MKPWTWLKIAAVLQGIGTVLHTIATTVRPNHGAAEQAVFNVMRSFHFEIMGANRTIWDFYRGYELSITVVFATIAVLLWQLGNLSKSDAKLAMPLLITMLAAQVLLDVVSWAYFFAGPGTMSILIAVCLIAAILMLSRRDQPAAEGLRLQSRG